jgi:protein involved in plasmid replication-relaxation
MLYILKDMLKPKYHKKLNTEQLAVLQLLYAFRFATSKQIAMYQQKQTSKRVQARLKILEDQELISKRYDKTYKLRGKPASYYLLPKGARTLESHIAREPDEPINIRRIYKDKQLSESFIEHCSNVLQTFLILQQSYPAKGTLKYIPRSRLDYEKYDYFPHPLPDAYIRIKTSTGEKQFFLDIFEDSQPFFVLIRRIKKYLEYSGDGDWEDTGTDLPVILIACANTSMQKRLRKRLAKELRDSYEEATFATTTIEAIKNSNKTRAKIWLPIDEDGDDPDAPPQPMSLNTP